MLRCDMQVNSMHTFAGSAPLVDCLPFTLRLHMRQGCSYITALQPLQ